MRLEGEERGSKGSAIALCYNKTKVYRQEEDAIKDSKHGKSWRNTHMRVRAETPLPALDYEAVRRDLSSLTDRCVCVCVCVCVCMCVCV